MLNFTPLGFFESGQEKATLSFRGQVEATMLHLEKKNLILT